MKNWIGRILFVSVSLFLCMPDASAETHSEGRMRPSWTPSISKPFKLPNVLEIDGFKLEIQVGSEITKAISEDLSHFLASEAGRKFIEANKKDLVSPNPDVQKKVREGILAAFNKKGVSAETLKKYDDAVTKLGHTLRYLKQAFPNRPEVVFNMIFPKEIISKALDSQLREITGVLAHDIALERRKGQDGPLTRTVAKNILAASKNEASFRRVQKTYNKEINTVSENLISGVSGVLTNHFNERFKDFGIKGGVQNLNYAKDTKVPKISQAIFSYRPRGQAYQELYRVENMQLAENAITKQVEQGLKKRAE